MKTILAILVIAIALTAISVYAPQGEGKNLQAMTVANKLEYKTMLKNYFHPVMHGYGIGFTSDTYITAKWHITDVRILAKNRIREIISGVNNTTDWSQIKQEIQDALQSEGNEIKKGRIMIGKTNYVLTNILISNNTATADIRELPDYSACKQANTTAEDCENNTALVGSLSLTKKTKAIEDAQGDPKVWAGTLTFRNVTYTFVTFAYPKW